MPRLIISTIMVWNLDALNNHFNDTIKMAINKTMLTLIRTYHPEGTCGKLYDNDGLFCRTLERPNLGNRRDDPKTKANESSCIPEGIYKVVRDKIGKFKYFSIQDVPNRSNIEIHPANSIDDLLGCTGPGEEIQDNKYGYRFWLTNSRRTCDKLLAKYPKGFDLKITSDDSECSK
jgi:hypothetical protein